MTVAEDGSLMFHWYDEEPFLISFPTGDIRIRSSRVYVPFYYHDELSISEELCVSSSFFLPRSSRQGIRFSHFFSWHIVNSKVKFVKLLGPRCLTTIQPLLGLEILESLVVCMDNKGLRESSQPGTPMEN